MASEKCIKTANIYLAFLRSLYLIYQHHHWTTTGKDFYQKHLLFQRLYEDIVDITDEAAEKFLGVFGSDCIRYDLQTQMINKILNRYQSETNDLIKRSLMAEQDFQKLAKETYDCFEKENTLTLGLDDMLMSQASEREEAIYLLQQTANPQSK